ncbi:MAG: GNAT family N-acetyltransferase [Oscillospiraceae bacterium]
MNLTFSNAETSNIDEIMRLLSCAIKHMERNDIHQWDEIYPSRKIIAGDIRKHELFVGRIGGQIAVIFVVNSKCNAKYKIGAWSTNTENFLVIHRLCVHPDFQNQGVAKAAMAYIENNLCSLNIEAIRLDVFKQNPHALRLYKNNGFQITGEVEFRKGGFYLMEKLLGF